MPVSLLDAREQVTVEHVEDDRLLRRLIKSATDYAEQYCNRPILASTWAHYFDVFENPLKIAMAGVRTIDSVVYQDSDDVEQTLAASAYYTDVYRHPMVLMPVDSFPNTFDRPNAVTVTVSAGFLDGAVPEAIRHAILMMVAHHFENRESAVLGTIGTEVPMSAKMLMDAHRVYGL